MKLSDTVLDQFAGIRESYILHVPLRYLQYYEGYSDEEKNEIGAFIWKYKQLGFLDIEHLRKVTYPPVVAYLNEELANEGGPGTGRGYKIYKILNKLKDLDKTEELAGANPPANEIVKQPVTSVTEAKVVPEEIAEEAPEESTNWLLWFIGALVILGGLVVVARRKS